jgi:ankyrin repeat protein
VADGDTSGMTLPKKTISRTGFVKQLSGGEKTAQSLGQPPEPEELRQNQQNPPALGNPACMSRINEAQTENQMADRARITPKPIARHDSQGTASTSHRNKVKATKGGATQPPKKASDTEMSRSGQQVSLAQVHIHSIDQRNGEIAGLSAAIAPSNYMKDAWEAASSIATSAMSDTTRKSIRFAITNKWLDRDLKYLEYYAKLGKAAALRTLLECSCNPGTKSNPRPRPLLNAVRGGSQRHNKCVNLLLSFGANVNARDERTGKTAIHYAIENQKFVGYNNLLRDLVDYGADPNSKDKNGDYPLLKILYGSYEPLEKHRLDALALLLQSKVGAEVNIVSTGTLNTPLHLAIRRKDPMAVGMLLHVKADINKPNASGMTPLLLATNQWRGPMTNDQETILGSLLGTLLDHGQSIELDVKGGPSEYTALHQAVVAGAYKAVVMLLEKGADPLAKDKDGCNVIQTAVAHADRVPAEVHAKIMTSILVSVGVDVPTNANECLIDTAISTKNTDLIQSLTNLGVDVTVPKNRSRTLHNAANDRNGADGRVIDSAQVQSARGGEASIT